jgi:cell division protein FtsB
VRKILIPGLLLVAIYYALFGGEYGYFDSRRFRAETEEARRGLEELQRITDSLRIRADSLEFDPRALETLARERFGMIREGEILYRFADPVDPEGL